MSVIRYTPRICLIESSGYTNARLFEAVDDDGQFVLYYDYSTLLTRHNALVIEHTALLINHTALREAVKKMRYANNKERWDALEWIESCAEVDRLLGGE
jgi:hypothetical protein